MPVFFSPNFIYQTFETFTENTFKLVLNSKHKWNNRINARERKMERKICEKNFIEYFQLLLFLWFAMKLTREQFQNRRSFVSFYHGFAIEILFIFLVFSCFFDVLSIFNISDNLNGLNNNEHRVITYNEMFSCWESLMQINCWSGNFYWEQFQAKKKMVNIYQSYGTSAFQKRNTVPQLTAARDNRIPSTFDPVVNHIFSWTRHRFC